MPFPLLLGASLALPFAGRLARPLLGLIRRRPVAAAALAGGGALGVGSLAGKIGLGGGEEEVVKRRRKRALTADDMRIALTIASAISKKAAENFVLQRTRR